METALAVRSALNLIVFQVQRILLVDLFEALALAAIRAAAVADFLLLRLILLH